VGTIVVGALGDSITAGSPGWDPDPAVRERIGAPTPESSWEHWAALADPSLELRNYGVYGERTDEIARRLEVAAAGADVLVVQGGINDVAQGRPVEEAAASLRATVRRGGELGLRVLLCDVLPWNAGYPRFDGAIRRLNALVAAVAREESVALVPFHDTLEDPSRPGRMREDWVADGDHPSVAGYRRLADVVLGGLGVIEGGELREKRCAVIVEVGQQTDGRSRLGFQPPDCGL
jgi:lysophospholipase L1-like esterase